MTVLAWLRVPSILGLDQNTSITSVVFGEATVIAVCPADSLGAGTTFGAAAATVTCRVADGIQLIQVIPELIATQGVPPGTVVAQQLQPIAPPVFGTPSVSFATSHPATSIEPTAVFGVAVAQSVHEVASLESVVFGGIGIPTYSAPASSLFGQSTFGQPTVSTVHPLGDWYTGIRMGPVGASSAGSFPVVDSIESTEFGQPRLGGTSHPVMPLHMMPTFGPITIRRSHTC